MSELHFITVRDNSQNKRSLIKAEIDNIDEKHLDEI